MSDDHAIRRIGELAGREVNDQAVAFDPTIRA
jgi:hypothetical protein